MTLVVSDCNDRLHLALYELQASDGLPDFSGYQKWFGTTMMIFMNKNMHSGGLPLLFLFALQGGWLNDLISEGFSSYQNKGHQSVLGRSIWRSPLLEASTTRSMHVFFFKPRPQPFRLPQPPSAPARRSWIRETRSRKGAGQWERWTRALTLLGSLWVGSTN